MKTEICFQLRGDKLPGRYLKSFATEAAARRHAAKISNFPEDTIHYTLTDEAGETIWDTRKDGLL